MIELAPNLPASQALRSFYDWSPSRWQSVFPVATLAIVLSLRTEGLVEEATMHRWSALAHSLGSWCHVGRVNTQRRLRLCQMAGADSFDGSGPSRFELCLQRMERGLAQASMVLP